MNAFWFLDKFKSKPKKIKSICLESEPILEELEEYYPNNDMDVMNHTFFVPGNRARLNSSENAISTENIENNNSTNNNNNNNNNSLAPI